MQIDARTLPDGHTLEADLCVVGAGPAGITLARALAASDLRVAVLESGGGFTPDRNAQALCDGTTVGDPYAGPLLTRRRQAGGTVNDWNTPVGAVMGAKYVPLDAADFSERPWLPRSGWPFDLAELEPYYVRAHEVCGLGPYTYRAEDWADAGRAPLSLRSELLTTGVYRFGVGGMFTDRYLREIARAADVVLYLHATAVELETDRAGERVTQARLRCLTGRELRLRARAFVLAAGGIENARLLLLSGGGDPHGLGNGHDLVGRCFMEHPRDRSYTLVPYERTPMAFYVMHDTGRGPVMGRLALSEEAMRREHLLNMSITLFPPRRNYLVRRRRVRLLINLEQAPDPDNRVTLGAQRDALGLPKVQLEWRWREADQRNLERLRGVLGRELGRLGRLVSAPVPPDPNAHHHLGTTRMHRDPRQGVVGVHGRVHGLANLFVAGSSVFPTGGYANPTLTIVALALRLADHLRPQLTSGRAPT
jgi:choline dehydrogenase-like flavoprotein